MKEVRKIIALVVALLMLTSVSTLSASAADFDASVTANKAVAAQYGTVVFTVSIDNITAENGMLSVDVPFDFDPAVFEFVSVAAEYPSAWGKPEYFGYAQPEDGFMWLRMVNDEDSFGAESGCAEGGVMRFMVTLRVKGDAPLGVTTVSAVGDGVFNVLCGTAADGECGVVYGSGSELSLSVTEASFAVVFGDVNGDGSSDNLDAAFVLRYDAMLTELDEQQLVCADVNGDGTVNSLDAAVILRYDAGLITEFPIQ